MAKTISFDVNSKRTHEAIALIYDLEGFSKFVNQPDVQNYVPRFLNHVSRAIGFVIHGGAPYWLPDEDSEMYAPLRPPAHQKFLGDGALYIWTFTRADPPTIRFSKELCNRLRDLGRNFKKIEREAYDKVPVAERPRRVRFGLAAGLVHEFRRTDVPRAPHEFAGVCINLASRLQSYCPNVTLTASAKLGLREIELDKYDYVRVVAKQVKGFQRESVIIDKAEFEALSERTRKKYFDLD
jgi:class 3 adenylate cyclase